VLDLGHDVCLLPGLIDAHVHLAFDASADVVGGLAAVDDARLLDQMAWAAQQALRAGITTVRDLGDRSFLALRLRDQLDASGQLGPQIVASGPPITIHAGHCHFLGGVATGVEQLRAAVRERFRATRRALVAATLVSIAIAALRALELPRIDRRVSAVGGPVEASCHVLMHEVGREYAQARHLTLSDLQHYVPRSNNPNCSAGFGMGLVMYLGPQILRSGGKAAAAACARLPTTITIKRSSEHTKRF